MRQVIDRVSGILGGEGRVIVRPSGTEPLLRIFCEMDREDRAAAEVRRLEEFLGLDGRKAE